MRGERDLGVRAWWIVLLTALAVVLRSIGLGSGLWLDEILSLAPFYRPPLVEVLTTFRADTQHTLYALAANAAIKLLGEDEWVIRLPAMLFGAATVPLLYWLGAVLTTRREAFAAAALLALSYHHVWFSQNARGYTMLACWAILATGCLVRGLETPRRAWLVAFGAAGALGLYTHLTMAVVLASQALVVTAAAALARPGSGRREVPWISAMAGFALAALGGLLLYAPAFGDVAGFLTKTGVDIPRGTYGLRWALAETLAGLRTGLGLPAVVVGAVAFGRGLWSYARTAPLALALFVAPGVALVAAVELARGVVRPRFFFLLIGFGLLIAVRGCYELGRDLWSVWIAIARRERPRHSLDPLPSGVRAGDLMVLALLVVSAALLPRNYRVPKQDFAGAAAYVTARAAPGDVVVTVPGTDRAYSDYLPMPWIRLEQPGDEIAGWRAAGQRVWVVYSMKGYLARSHPALTATLERECHAPARFRGTLAGGDIWVCALEPEPADAAADPSPALSAAAAAIASRASP